MRHTPKIKTAALLLILSAMTTDADSQQVNKPTVQTQVGAATTVRSAPAAYGQDVRINYVRVREASGPITDVAAFDAAGYSDVKEVTNYYDGLGRSLQTVAKQATPGSSPRDIVSPVIYDAFGREEVRYLPYVQLAGNTSDGRFKNNPFNDQASFYQNTTLNPGLTGEQVYYSQTIFEASPLNRVEKAMAAGNSWAGSSRGVSQKYLINTEADGVRIWNIGNNTLTYANGDVTTNIPQSSGAYEAGQLYKNVMIDEQGNAVVEYKDKEGKVILKKVQSGSIAGDYSGYGGFLSTYYIYDDFGLLRYVIQPKGVEAIKSNWVLTGDVINELSFRYEYDYRQRMIAKKVPGAGWVYMVYDKRDRLVFSQDANMGTTNQWMAMLYDELNRPVMTGLIAYSGNREALQNYVTGTAGTSAPFTVTGSTVSAAPTDINFTVREQGRPLYEATSSVTLEQGFESENGAEFTVQIVGTPGTSFTENVNVYDNPVPAGSSLTVLTITYYDDYAWTSKDYTTAYNSQLDVGGNQHAETMPSVKSLQTKGMVTGTKIRVLEDPVNLSAGKFLATASFYDDKGRVIQVSTENYTGGTDILTSRYDFTGKVLTTYLVHNNAAGNQINLRVKTNMEYDHGGRLLEIWKTINDESSKKALIVRNEYDELGQLKKKELGRSRADNGTYTSTPLETLDYMYNIRGWLTAVNKDFAIKTGSNANSRWFGMELSYDWGFGENQFNGNIAGMKWRSRGDGEKRAYGFTYDKLNRLLGGDFSQDNGGGYVDDATVKFDMQMGDGVNAGSAYDENGNIKAMKQWGLKIGSSEVIDDLSYNYGYGGSQQTNKLLNVIDAVNAPETKLGDFRTSSLHQQSKTASTVDYSYDANGNLKKDLNKDIGNGSVDGIEYNHLNLPWRITVRKGAGQSEVKGTITYIYDAAGNKLRKLVNEGGQPQKMTDYVAGMVYENNVLQFLGHEEGRSRYRQAEGSTAASFAYDYFLKDHLGNVRAVLTDEQKTDAYPAATMEDGTVAMEENFYSNLNTRTGKPDGYPTDPYQDPNQKVSGLRGDGNKIGPAMVLKVMAGDKFSVRVSSWYNKDEESVQAQPNPFSELLEAMAGSVAGIAGGKATTDQLKASWLNGNMLNSYLSQQPGGTSKPKAFLSWILLDEQFRIAKDGSGNVIGSGYSGFAQVGEDNILTTFNFTDQPVAKSGYLYVYVSNETPNIAVFFDNLQVTHTRGPLLEETHYYPFGLTVMGISSKALAFGNPGNRQKWNAGSELANKEFSDGSGLELYETFYRNLDPQIGRFWQIDPEIESQESFSPYESMGNNPISNVDPLGDFKTKFGAKWHRFWHGGGNVGQNEYGEWYVTKSEFTTNESGEFVAKSWQYYGKGRDKYSTAKEALLRNIEIQNDIMSHGGRIDDGGNIVSTGTSMYQMYDSPEDAGKAALSIGTGVMLPNPVLKTGTITVNAAQLANKGRKIVKGIRKTISVQKQARHLAGTAKQGGSFLNSAADAQKVLDAVHSGEAVYLGTTSQGHHVFRYSGVTGTNVNIGAGVASQPTNVFMIKGTSSPSVVPTSPAWTP